MRIECPYCGERDTSEFTYLGDGNYARPVPNGPDADARFFAAIYLRDNPDGPHDELWYHAFGCRSWLRVTRNTRTHEVIAVDLARAANIS